MILFNSIVARFAGFKVFTIYDPRVALAALAHPGLNSAAAPRLVVVHFKLSVASGKRLFISWELYATLIFPIHNPILHHKHRPFHCVNVFQRIAGNCDDVSPFADGK